MVLNDDDTDDSGVEEEYSSLNRSLEVARSPSQDDLLPELECPVCFDLPLPPIRTCIRGHIICADCCCKLEKCPLCLQRIDVGRNFFAENFLNKSFLKCRFRADGCTKEIEGELMRHHMQYCEYRPLKCKLCSSTVLFSEFDNHMLSEHRIGRWDIADDGVKIVSSHKRRCRLRRSSSTPTATEDIQRVHVPLLVIISCLSLMTLMMVVLDHCYSAFDIDEDLALVEEEAKNLDLFKVLHDFLDLQTNDGSRNVWDVLSNIHWNKILMRE